MSTSLLCHAFGIVGYMYIHTRYENGAVIFKIAHNRFKLRCSCCGSKRILRRGTIMRRFKSIPIGLKSVFIEIELQRVLCPTCKVVRQVKLYFVKWRRTYTKAFERYALMLSKFMTILNVAKHLQGSWGTIKDIQKRLKRSKAKIKAVATDMSPAYIAAVQDNLPDTAIVFDNFHVIKMHNDQLSQLRRALFNEVSGLLEKQVLKGIRWLLLKKPENLNGDKGEQSRLQEALKLNQPLATAYYLKEDLRQFWKQKSKAVAKKLLYNWIGKAGSSKIAMLIKFAKTLRGHMFGPLNYCDHPISTGPINRRNQQQNQNTSETGLWLQRYGIFQT